MNLPTIFTRYRPNNGLSLEIRNGPLCDKELAISLPRRKIRAHPQREHSPVPALLFRVCAAGVPRVNEQLRVARIGGLNRRVCYPVLDTEFRRTRSTPPHAVVINRCVDVLIDFGTG
jgi:hypothetical protein